MQNGHNFWTGLVLGLILGIVLAVLVFVPGGRFFEACSDGWEDVPQTTGE
jgi:hypothetical protein